MAEDYDYDRHMCPVCGKYEFEEYGSFDICPFCEWEDDNLQYANHDYAGGANDMSVNQAREAYKYSRRYELVKLLEEIPRSYDDFVLYIMALCSTDERVEDFISFIKNSDSARTSDVIKYSDKYDNEDE